jgi:hypothetical protein
VIQGVTVSKVLGGHGYNVLGGHGSNALRSSNVLGGHGF